MKHVLITGGTGVLGSALVPSFLAEEGTEVHLLVRAANPEHLRERIGRLCAFWQTTPEDIAGRLHAHAGDVCQERFGLDDRTYRTLSQRLTHIVHGAGNVRLNQSLTAARHNAVGSMRHIVALASACADRGQLQKLEAVSTLGVAGRTSGLVLEERLEPPSSYRNTYEQAKAEAEHFLYRHIDEGLPATIHRPSMIVGDADTGRVLKFQVFYYLSELLTGRKTFGILPDLGTTQLDIVPVNYAARAIVLSANRPDATGKIFHLCSGPQDSLPLRRLTEFLREIYLRLGEPVPRLRQWSRSQFEIALALLRCVAWGRSRRALASLPLFLAYADDSQQAFDRRSTTDFFSTSLQLPPVETYVERIIGWYLDAKKLTSRR